MPPGRRVTSYRPLTLADLGRRLAWVDDADTGLYVQGTEPASLGNGDGAGILAAAELGLDPERTLLVPDLGDAWPQVVASLPDGCEIVLVRPPGPPPAQVRQRLEAVLRRGWGVLLIVGDWPGVPVRLQVTARRWAGLGDGHGRLRACLAEVTADGRGGGGDAGDPLAVAARGGRQRHRGQPCGHPRDGQVLRRICARSAGGADVPG